MPPPKNQKEARGTAHGSSSFSVVNFTIRAVPLPKPILEFTQDNISVLKKIIREKEIKDAYGTTTGEVNKEDDEYMESATIHGDIIRRPTVRPEDFWTTLEQKFNEAGNDWRSMASRVWAFGPQSAGACMLLDVRSNERPCS